MEDETRRKFVISGLAVVAAAAAGVAGFKYLPNLSQKAPDELLFDAPLDNHWVKYWNGDSNSPDKLQIFNLNDGKAGDLVMVIEDWDGNDIIGDHKRDKYLTFTNGEVSKTFMKDYFARNGVEFTPQMDDSLAKKVLENTKDQLEAATKIYTDYKELMAKQISL